MEKNGLAIVFLLKNTMLKILKDETHISFKG